MTPDDLGTLEKFKPPFAAFLFVFYVVGIIIAEVFKKCRNAFEKFFFLKKGFGLFPFLNFLQRVVVV